MSDAASAGRKRGPIAARWGALVLAALLPPGINLVAVALLWILVLGSLGRAGVGLATAMTLAAMTLHLLVYVAF